MSRTGAIGSKIRAARRLLQQKRHQLNVEAARMGIANPERMPLEQLMPLMHERRETIARALRGKPLAVAIADALNERSS